MKKATLTLARKIQRFRFEAAIWLSIRADRLGKRCDRTITDALERINEATLALDDINRSEVNRNPVRGMPSRSSLI